METENNTIEPATTEKKKKKKLSFRDWINGKLLTEDFIVKQSKLFLLIFFLIIVFITNRYYCSKQLSEMNRLKIELSRLQNEQVDLTSRLTRTTQQAKIEELLKGKGIELSKDSATVYEIHK